MYLGRLARLRPVRLLVQNSRFWFKTDSWCKARLTTTAIPAGQRVRAGVEQPQPFLLPLFAEARRREILVKLKRSKSPLLVTSSRRKSHELALNPGGQADPEQFPKARAGGLERVKRREEARGAHRRKLRAGDRRARPVLRPRLPD